MQQGSNWLKHPNTDLYECRATLLQALMPVLYSLDNIIISSVQGQPVSLFWLTWVYSTEKVNCPVILFGHLVTCESIIPNS